MKVRNELQTVRVQDRGEIDVEGVVRVRTIDARVRGRGPVFGSHQPVGVVVHTHGGVRRLSLPAHDGRPGALVALAGPVLFLATKRFFRKGRRR